MTRWQRMSSWFVMMPLVAGLTLGGAEALASPPEEPSVHYVLAARGLPENSPRSRVVWKSTPVFADFNKDGLLDLAVHSRLGDGPRVWLGDGKGVWTEASEGLKVSGHSCGGGIAVGDINQDGDLDLAVADHCDGVFVYLGDGQGHWKTVTQELNPAIAQEVDFEQEGENTFTGAEDLALGDVNGDGFLDLVVGASDEGGFSVYFGDGSGKKWKEDAAPGLPSAGSTGPTAEEKGGWANRLLLHDIDGDGYQDIVASYYSGPRVWRGDGKGAWEPYSDGLPQPLIGGIFWGLAVGDVNEDGRLDLAVANSVNGPEIFLQNQDGVWQRTPDMMPSLRGGAQAVALGDLDQDGHLDVVAGGSLERVGTGYGVFVLRGDGKGGWTSLEGPNLPTKGLPFVWGIALGDVNSDGMLDFAVATGGRVAGTRRLNQDKEAFPLVQVWVNQHKERTPEAAREVSPDPPSDKAAQATEQLHQLFQEEWERHLRENPVFASSLGDRRYNDQWGDRSLEAIRASHEANQKALEQLHSINRIVLPENEKLNYALFEQQLETEIEGFQYRAFLMPLDQQGGVQTLHEVTNRLRFQTEKDFRDWIARLNQIDRVVGDTIKLMRVGLEEGRTQPKLVMERIPDQIALQVVAQPKESPFYQVFREMPERIPTPTQVTLRQQAKQAIMKVVIPAYRQFQVFFKEQYLPHCRKTIGAQGLPNGKAFYAYRVRRFTTTDLTPESIHQIGLEEVARIRNEMEKTIDQVGFSGSFDEFLHFLRTDSQFYYQDPQALLEGYRAIAKKIDPKLVTLFGKLPRMPYGVKPIPRSSAPDRPTGYYQQPAADGSRAGYYYVNLYKPEIRPKYEMEVLTLHEAVPGHHLQIALQQELEDLPNFRRFFGFTAFAEGWGLYAESLGEELGLYQDSYSKFGQLTYEMWRAIRLVVDTGIHAKGWTRQQAIAFFKKNAAKTEHDIVNEVDRYIAWPGQALAYKIGQLKIQELRQRALEKLGKDFDIRAFHDRVLGSGSIPLNILERDIEEWIEAQQKK